LSTLTASVVDVNVGIPLVSAGLLYMLDYLLPSALTENLKSAISTYEAAVPTPPYFDEGIPRFAVYNHYNRFMDPGALPLQYVKIVADRHIQQFWPKVSVEIYENLAELYAEASRALKIDPPTLRPTGRPTNAPTAATPTTPTTPVPTPVPTSGSTRSPTAKPTARPLTPNPTANPTAKPTNDPLGIVPNSP